MARMIVLIVIALLLCGPASAAPPPDADLNGPLHAWFERQRSAGGLWCCDVSDGHILADDEWRTSDGGYEVLINGQWFRVPDIALRDPSGGPNPTGHAIAWYRVAPNGYVRIYCFAPGWAG